MTTPVFTEHELTLLNDAMQGLRTHFPENTVIRGDILRRLLMGLPIRRQEGAEAETIALPSSGLHITGATIEGELDLRDASTQDGQALPPLMLRKCIIPQVIWLRRAHIRHLCLYKSFITHLCAREAVISGSLDLSGVRSPEYLDKPDSILNEGQCWIELQGAKIDGNVIADNAKLRRFSPARPPAPVPAPASAPDSGAGANTVTVTVTGAGTDTRCSALPADSSNFALDLSGASIGGGVILSPGFHARDGISIAHAHIRNSLNAIGATLIAGVGGDALLADGVEVGGDVFLRADELRLKQDGVPAPFLARGGISLFNAHIGGSFRMCGATIDSLVIERGHIGGSVLLRGLDGADGEIARFVARKNIRLYGSHIGGNLEMTGAYIKGTVQAELVKIGSYAILGTMKHKTAASKPARLTSFLAEDDINLISAEIASHLDMQGATLKGKLLANHMRIGGNALLSAIPNLEQNCLHYFSARHEVDLSNIRIIGNLHMSGAKLAGELNLRHADIRGNAILKAWDNHDCLDEPLESQAANAFAKTAEEARKHEKSKIDKLDLAFSAEQQINLHSTRVGGNLDMAGALLNAGLEARHLHVSGSLELTGHHAYHFDTKGDLVFTAAKVAGKMNVAIVTPSAKHNMITVTLTDAEVGTLSDRLNDGWDDAHLHLDGFRYRRINNREDSHSHFHPSKTAATQPLQATPVRRHGPAGQHPASDLSVAERRINWLNRQYETPGTPTLAEYNPHSYQQLAEAFRAEGEDHNSRKITSARLNVERQLEQSLVLRSLSWVYYKLFDYGLSPKRAIFTFFVFILIGAISVSVATYHPLTDDPVMVVDPSPVSLIPPANVASSASVEAAGKADIPAATVNTGNGQTAGKDKETACGDRIDSILYAIDIFVPALELHQEKGCAMSTQHGWPWRWALALYSVAGWIVTSLTLLTVSGILRRHVER